MERLAPYTFKRIGTRTFIINLNGENFLTLENSNEEYVLKITNLLNGAFREGVIFGHLNNISEL